MRDFRQWQAVQGRVEVRLRCPGCGVVGMFDPPPPDCPDLLGTPNGAGPRSIALIRRCPRVECRQLVFGQGTRAGAQLTELVTFPQELLHFDTTNLPAEIVSTLSEAAICIAAGAYRAAAMMVRRTLEELCSLHGATGKDLYTRVAKLGDSVVLPPALLTGLHHLRLLGNDAGHIEARTYQTIGENEVTVAFEVCTEILKAVYQYEDLVGRLEALKKPSQ